MAVEARITLNKQQYVQELEAVKSKTKQTTAEVGQAARQTGENFSRVGGAASAMGSVVGQKFGALGQAISALAAGPLGLLIAGFAALAAAAIKVYDAFTVSREEAEELARVQQAALREQIRLAKEEDDYNNRYFKRLQDLSKMQTLSNAQQKEAQRLVEALRRSYGDLGIAIDSATGKITGLDAAQKKMALAQLQRQFDLQTLDQSASKSMIEALFHTFANEAYHLGNTTNVGPRRQAFVNDLMTAWGGGGLMFNAPDPRGLQQYMQTILKDNFFSANSDAMRVADSIMQKLGNFMSGEMRLEDLQLQLAKLGSETDSPAAVTEELKGNSTRIRNAEIYTNDLTSRGGFATGGRVESLHSINDSIKRNTASMAGTLRSIETKVSGYDKVKL